MLDASFNEVKKLFVLAFNGTAVDADNNPINNAKNRVGRRTKLQQDKEVSIPRDVC